LRIEREIYQASRLFLDNLFQIFNPLGSKHGKGKKKDLFKIFTLFLYLLHNINVSLITWFLKYNIPNITFNVAGRNHKSMAMAVA
jgi:hypothetical protein